MSSPTNNSEATETLSASATLFHGFALPHMPALIAAIDSLDMAQAQHFVTPGGFTMSVNTLNCGEWGWVSDRRGYRYSRTDLVSGKAWQPMPIAMLALAQSAAQAAGFAHFQPDACLVNQYVVGAGMSLHQDKNEADFAAPIVSVSLGLPATFLWGGMLRSDKPARVPLIHGDVVVWGGVSRLRFHGVMPIKAKTAAQNVSLFDTDTAETDAAETDTADTGTVRTDPFTASQVRINLTFRQAVRGYGLT